LARVAASVIGGLPMLVKPRTSSASERLLSAFLCGAAGFVATKFDLKLPSFFDEGIHQVASCGEIRYATILS
jgi:hypothetical protein